MISSNVQVGYELNQFYEQVFTSNPEHQSWIIPRNKEKNRTFNINGLVVSGKLSHKSIGMALQVNANVIHLIHSLSFNRLLKNWHNNIEMLYKKDIYLFCFQKFWYFFEPIGIFILIQIFGGSSQGHWRENLDLPHLYLSFPKLVHLGSILSRFSDCLWWINPKIIDENGKLKLDSILIVQGSFDIETLITVPTVIISTDVNSDMINLCWTKKIGLIWINSDQILNEIAREVSFLLAKHFKKFKVHFAELSRNSVRVK